MAGFDWSTYQKQDVKSVDMCAVYIYGCLRKNQPLKAIHLWPDWYNEFKRWAEKKSGQVYEDGVNLQFNSIEIKLGERSQSKPLLLELWMDDSIPVQEQLIQDKINGLAKYGRVVKKGFEPIMKLVTKLNR